MQRMSIKLAGIAALCLLFWLCLAAVRGVLFERQAYAEQVVADIGREYVAEQTIMAPFVQVPVMSVCAADAAPAAAKPTPTPTPAAASGWVGKAACKPTLVRMAVLLPQAATWQQQWQVRDGQFQRGIYATKSFNGTVAVSGSLDARQLVLANNESADWAQAQWRMAVSDRRGLAAMPVLKIGSQAQTFVAQAGLPVEGGIRWLQAPAQIRTDAAQPFAIDFELAGTQSVRVLPLGEDTVLNMQANWPHPGFFGTNLPLEKSINAQDFSARWHNPAAGQDNANMLQGCLNAGAEQVGCWNWDSGWQQMGVRFVDTTDNYSLTERSLKYGMLFIVLTFGTFFLYEVLRDLRIHPVQYVLVGAALTVFYLLLLSFGEQVGFDYAYAGAAAACIGLIGWYLHYVLAGWRHALACSGLLALLYALLYWLLHTDENTLLIGSLLMFALIALAMFLTRRVDWYALPSKAVRRLPEKSGDDGDL